MMIGWNLRRYLSLPSPFEPVLLQKMSCVHNIRDRDGCVRVGLTVWLRGKEHARQAGFDSWSEEAEKHAAQELQKQAAQLKKLRGLAKMAGAA